MIKCKSCVKSSVKLVWIFYQSSGGNLYNNTFIRINKVKSYRFLIELGNDNSIN